MTARRIGLVGLGTISRYYLRAIERSPDWELAGVCDVRAAALGPHLSRATGYLDHRDMFQTADLDAVVITAPNDAHALVCRDALRAGVPVCVEKPLAVTLEEGRALANAAAGGPVLFTAFLVRARKVAVPGRSETVAENERLLAVLIAAGLTNAQLATVLGSSEKSVEGRLTRFFNRTGYRSRAELATAALRGFLD